MHEPDFADDFCRDGSIALQLSGHSHGGQVRLPLWGSPFLPPHGRKYDKGLYRVQDMWLYTNVGIGVTAPIRINCPPEVTELTLVRA
jgi:predicted MPP superfamily phosphohydrolase